MALNTYKDSLLQDALSKNVFVKSFLEYVLYNEKDNYNISYPVIDNQGYDIIVGFEKQIFFYTIEM